MAPSHKLLSLKNGLPPFILSDGSCFSASPPLCRREASLGGSRHRSAKSPRGLGIYISKKKNPFRFLFPWLEAPPDLPLSPLPQLSPPPPRVSPPRAPQPLPPSRGQQRPGPRAKKGGSSPLRGPLSFLPFSHFDLLFSRRGPSPPLFSSPPRAPRAATPATWARSP